jgi:hypothetical protein
MAVTDAVRQASALLDRPSCARTFDAFTDSAGQPLSAVLRSSGRTPPEWLSSLYFTDGDVRRCRADPSMAAYTAPGNRVVWICGERFAERFSMSVRPGAYLIIHEALHSAGLGENPPSSSAITAVVARNCR